MGWGLGFSNDNSLLGMSGLVTINNTGFLVHTPVPPKMEQLLINATISAIGLGLANQTTTIQMQQWETYYLYAQPLQLLLSYGLALLLAVAAVVVGLVSLTNNGVTRDRGFFQILRTTRNPELDQFIKGPEKDNVEFLKTTSLRFGRSWDESQSYFGTESSLRPIR